MNRRAVAAPHPWSDNEFAKEIGPKITWIPAFAGMTAKRN